MSKTFTGYSILFVPADWQLGAWHKPNGYRTKKSIYAFGPLRFVIHRELGAWKPDPVFEPAINRGKWLHGEARSERLTRSEGPQELAGGALEPKVHPRERDGFHGDARSGELGFDG